MNFKTYFEKLRALPDKHKKIIMWAIVAVLAVVLGYFWLISAEKNLQKIGQSVSQVKFPEIQTPATESPVAQALVDQTADWQTYTNDKYGFEFKYPLSLSIKEGSSGVDSISINLGSNGYVLYSFYAGDRSSENINNIVNPKISDYTEIINGKLIIDNTNWNTIEEIDIPQEGIGTAGSLLNVYTTEGNSAYILQCIGCSADIFGADGKNKKAVFDQILSTFKFIKK